eukprot:874761_1
MFHSVLYRCARKYTTYSKMFEHAYVLIVVSRRRYVVKPVFNSVVKWPGTSSRACVCVLVKYMQCFELGWIHSGLNNIILALVSSMRPSHLSEISSPFFQFDWTCCRYCCYCCSSPIPYFHAKCEQNLV